MTFDTRIYFGRPGRLATLHSPRGSVNANRQRRISTFELGAGGTAIDQMTGGARTFQIEYEQLTRDDWATLEAFAQGHEGPGPFALLDPGQRNRLPANMSGATSVTNDTDNFSVAGTGSSLASSDTYADAGPRTLAWTMINASAGASGTDVLTPDWPSSVFPYGVPAVVGQSLCFSCYVRGGGGDPTVQLTPQLIYRDIAGVALSTTSGTPVTTSSGAFAQMFVTATAPASTVYADWAISSPTGQASFTDTFESGVGNWISATGGAITSSTAQAQTGTSSGLFTTSGSEPQAYVRPAAFACVGGSTITASMWFYSPAGYANLALNLDWFDENGSYITTTGGGTSSIAAATWTQRTAILVAPANAASVSFGPTLSGSPPNGTQLYMDNAVLTGIATTVYLRRFMLNEGATPDTLWMPGTGVWPVRFGELPDAWPYLSPELRERPSVVLIEDVT